MKRKLVIPFILSAAVIAGCSSENTVTLESGKFTMNGNSFDKFVKTAQSGKKAAVTLSYTEEGSSVSIVELTYDGDKYSYHTVSDSENIDEEYKYLYHFEGTYKDLYTYSDYILANSKDLTYDTLQNLIISSDAKEVDSDDEIGYRYLSSDHTDLT